MALSRSVLSNYEQGTREPDYDTLIYIATYFNVSIDYILGVSDVKTRIVDKDTNDKYKNTINDIFSLNKNSINTLEEWIELLKLKNKD